MTNGEKVHPELELELLGEKKKLKFTLNAFCLFEEVTGLDVLAGDHLKRLDGRTVSALLWAALRSGNQTNMTLEEFRENVALKDLAFFRGLVLAGMKQAMPVEKKSEEENPQSQEPTKSDQEPTGSKSGQSADTTSESPKPSTES